MKKYFVGIDLGGTNVRLIIYEENTHQIVSKVKKNIKFYNDVEEEVQENIIHIIEYERKKNNIQKNTIAGIGISIAANFQRDTGNIIKWSNNKKWCGFNLKKYLEEIYSTEVLLEDDANCAGYAEYIYNCAEEVKNLIYITVSTGIGAALIINGDLFIGDKGFAGELGHIKFESVKEKCTCGDYGCLQAVSSGIAISKKLNEIISNNNIKIDMNEKIDDLINNLAVKDEWINEAFSDARLYMCKAVYMLATIFGIENFILGGGVAKNKKYFFDPLRKEIKKHSNKIILRQALLGDYNGALGALGFIYTKVTKKKIYVDEKSGEESE